MQRNAELGNIENNSLLLRNPEV